MFAENVNKGIRKLAKHQGSIAEQQSSVSDWKWNHQEYISSSKWPAFPDMTFPLLVRKIFCLFLSILPTREQHELSRLWYIDTQVRLKKSFPITHYDTWMCWWNVWNPSSCKWAPQTQKSSLCLWKSVFWNEDIIILKQWSIYRDSLHTPLLWNVHQVCRVAPVS